MPSLGQVDTSALQLAVVGVALVVTLNSLLVIAWMRELAPFLLLEDPRMLGMVLLLLAEISRSMAETTSLSPRVHQAGT